MFRYCTNKQLQITVVVEGVIISQLIYFGHCIWINSSLKRLVPQITAIFLGQSIKFIPPGMESTSFVKIMSKSVKDSLMVETTKDLLVESFHGVKLLQRICHFFRKGFEKRQQMSHKTKWEVSHLFAKSTLQ